jgi:hypothetical protein
MRFDKYASIGRGIWGVEIGDGDVMIYELNGWRTFDVNFCWRG